MSSLNSPSVLLTVRGTVIPPDREATRQLHNQTAGSPEGVAAARSLGDLSHNVFTPVPGMAGAEENELLFLDVWKDAQGIGTFFSDEQVQHGANLMFSEREAVVWMPAEGAFGFELSPPMHLTGRYLGVARGTVDDPQNAINVFRKVLEPTISDARQHGQISHQLYVRLPMPDQPAPAEVLGLDLWADAAGMGAYYESLSGFEAAFSAAPETSVWESATGGTWTEW
ncbi:MAG: hypothetical protein HKO63_09140 [Acidimicrobiia bacterium]|nr:hypothetical protein [Acidimicrobiia bacterium]NNL98353.1 hypothetical protein [Acidimicrobiia bacterium]